MASVDAEKLIVAQRRYAAWATLMNVATYESCLQTTQPFYAELSTEAYNSAETLDEIRGCVETTRQRVGDSIKGSEHFSYCNLPTIEMLCASINNNAVRQLLTAAPRDLPQHILLIQPDALQNTLIAYARELQHRNERADSFYLHNLTESILWSEFIFAPPSTVTLDALREYRAKMIEGVHETMAMVNSPHLAEEEILKHLAPAIGAVSAFHRLACHIIWNYETWLPPARQDIMNGRDGSFVLDPRPALTLAEKILRFSGKHERADSLANDFGELGAVLHEHERQLIIHQLLLNLPGYTEASRKIIANLSVFGAIQSLEDTKAGLDINLMHASKRPLEKCYRARAGKKSVEIMRELDEAKAALAQAQLAHQRGGR